MASLFSFSPTWLGRVRLALPPTQPSLTTLDCSVALYAVARALAFDADVRYERDGRTLLEHMRERRDGVVAANPYPFAYRLHRHEYERHVPRVRTAMWQRCMSRVATMTDRGELVFSKFEPDGDMVSVELAPATYAAHPALGPKRAVQGTGHLSASIDPGVIARMSSASSALLACRLAAWWQAGTRVGIQGLATELDVSRGRLHAVVPVADVAEALGIVAARAVPSILDLTLDRVARDMSDHLGADMSWSWEPQGARAQFLALTVVHRSTRAPTVHEQHVEHEAERVAEFESARPVAVVAPAAPLSRPGRLVLRGQPVPVPVPMAPADVLPDNDDGEGVTWVSSVVQIPDDPLVSVKGFLGRDRTTMQPVYEDDHALLDIARTWYPHVTYPALDPREPWYRVTISKPEREGGPSVVDRRACGHLPSPDLSRYPHMHNFGVWSSIAYSEVHESEGGDYVYAEVWLPGADGPTYCVTRDDYDRVVAPARSWRRPPYPHERAEAERLEGLSTVERLRAEWCEEHGLDPEEAVTPYDD